VKPDAEVRRRNVEGRTPFDSAGVIPHSASMPKPLVIVTEPADKTPMAWLYERCRVVEASSDSPEFDAALPDAEGLMVRTYTKVNDALLDRAPKLKVVGRGGVGIENIDVKACRARGVEVVYTPDANTLAVGDYVFSLILQLLRPYAFFKERAYEPKEFKKVRNGWMGRQLNEMTIGILGMGRVGRRVGKIAADGFGMRVLYNDLLGTVDLPFSATSVDKATLLRDSDVLSLHVDMRPGNAHLIGAAELAQMKSDAILLNTCRGEVLDEHALADALRNKRLFAAALDVYAPEPPPADFPLIGLDNVLLAPHMAARTATAIQNMSWVVRDIVGVLNGEKPKYPAP
jgi:phosphoglycerate dehydrogenase-like enzyme